MKKLLIFIALTFGLFAQNTDKGTTTVSMQDAIYKSFEATNQVLRVTTVPSRFNETVKLDSLSTGDTTKTFYFSGKYSFGIIELFDSAGVTDTFYVEMYDTLNPYTSLIWRSNSIGLMDLVTNTMTPSTTGRYGLASNGIIIPGSGVVRRYLINEPRPRTWRVWMPASVLSGKKRYIKWIGRN